MNTQQRSMFWNTLQKSPNQDNFIIKHKVSHHFDDEYLMISINHLNSSNLFTDVHLTLWKKPWINSSVFHFVCGIQKKSQEEKDLYGTFKIWYQCTLEENRISIAKYYGKDVRNNVKKSKHPNHPSYQVYQKNLDSIREQYFTVFRNLIQVYGK